MDKELILFTVSILPIVLIGLFIYKRDKKKESARLLTKLFFGGVAACFITSILSMLLEMFIPFFGMNEFSFNRLELAIYVFIGVALIEEFSKWIMAYKLSYYDIEFDEFFDMIIYCVFVSLGFACFENLFYVFETGIKTGFLRAISAVPGHACDGFFMGYYLGISKIYAVRNQNKMQKRYLFLSVLVPTLAHGLYDYCLFNGETVFIIIFLVYLVLLFIYIIVKVIKLSRNPFVIR